MLGVRHQRDLEFGRAMAAILVQLIFAALLALAFGLEHFAPDRFDRLAQEDEALEWATFWAFILAAVAYARLTLAQRRGGRPWPWFAAGIALFCVFVAMEEISWGQRLLGLRSPEYFLANNFQQEINLHNVTDSDLRQAAFLLIVIGYGVALPAIAMFSRASALLDRIGVDVPPAWVVGPFAATAIVYDVYPIDYAGEWAEAMLGLGMLCSGVAQLAAVEPSGASLVRRIGVAALSAVALGAATATLWSAFAAVSPAHLEEARAELEALRQDYSSSRTRTRCGIHKRVYTHVVDYGLDHMYEGQFASLVGSGLPEERARYFIDPWGSPYWIKHMCADDGSRRAIFVYSFGPNRNRDATDWGGAPDDLVGWVSRPEPIASE